MQLLDARSIHIIFMLLPYRVLKEYTINKMEHIFYTLSLKGIVQECKQLK